MALRRRCLSMKSMAPVAYPALKKQIMPVLINDNILEWLSDGLSQRNGHRAHDNDDSDGKHDECFFFLSLVQIMSLCSATNVVLFLDLHVRTNRVNYRLSDGGNLVDLQACWLLNIRWWLAWAMRVWMKQANVCLLLNSISIYNLHVDKFRIAMGMPPRHPSKSEYSSSLTALEWANYSHFDGKVYHTITRPTQKSSDSDSGMCTARSCFGAWFRTWP